jgi:tetratricopeptide (TPR) repeat protein
MPAFCFLRHTIPLGSKTIQLLLGDTVGNMEDYQTAVSYYQSALEAIDVVPRLMDLPVINAKLSEANDLAVNGNYTDAFSTYQEFLQDIDVVYKLSEIEINDGVCLAFFANEYLSTVDAVLEANNLPKTMVITLGRKLIVPMLEK